MLAREVAAAHGDRVVIVEEDYADSELAREHEIDRYPAFFVDGELFAGPTDFYTWGESTAPRYTPWTSESVRATFVADLGGAIERALAGERVASRRAAGPALTMPAFELRHAAGAATIDASHFAGQVTLIEFWATWCVPCATSMPWLVDAARRHGDGVAAMTVALESPPEKVADWIERHPGPVRWALGDDAVRAAFGGVPVVPSLFVFDRDGVLVGTFVGAALSHRADLERLLNRLDPRPTAVAPSVSVTDGVRSEVTALRERVASLTGDAAERSTASLDAVVAKLEAGTPLAALYELEGICATVHAEQMQALGDEQDESAAAFDELWRRTMDAIHASEAELTARGPSPSLLQSALVDSAFQRARGYGRSARPYAKSSGLEAGRYYLGLARGFAAHAELCSTLDLGDADDLPLDPAAEIAQCDALILSLGSVFAERMRDPALLTLNATLKLARDQLRDGRPAGALLQALLVRARLEALRPVPGEPPTKDSLLERIESIRRKVATSKRALAALLVERAQAALAEAAPAEADLRYTEAVLTTVLPLLIGS